jgi:hypothetical protein
MRTDAETVYLTLRMAVMYALHLVTYGMALHFQSLQDIFVDIAAGDNDQILEWDLEPISGSGDQHHDPVSESVPG